MKISTIAPQVQRRHAPCATVPAGSGDVRPARTICKTLFAIGAVLLTCAASLKSAPVYTADFCGSDCVISEDFDDATSGDGEGVGTPPSGWENVAGENGFDGCFGEPCHDWWVNDGTDAGNPSTQVDFDHSDGLSNFLYVAADGNDNDAVSVLTPSFTLDSADEPYATFFVYSEYTGGAVSRANELHVDILDSSDNLVQSSAATIADTDIGHWRPAFVDLDGTASGTYRLRLRWESTYDQNDPGGGEHDIAIDDFAVVADRETSPGSGATIEQTYVLPAPENDILDFLEQVNTDPSIQAEDPVETYTAIAVVRDNAIIYFDEWEDDYENDVTNPTQTFGNTSGGPSPITASTQIWGDGYPENGYAPGYPHDVLSLGDVIILREPEIDTSPASSLSAVLDHDARDTLASTEEVAITRAFWASNSQTLNAGALELFPISRWGSNFELPMGEDIDPGDLDSSTSCGDNNPFQEVALYVMADTDGTSVAVDYDGDGGTPDFSGTLDRGESQFIGLGDDVNVGATVSATGGNVQVHVFTADTGSNYGSRFYTLLPRAQYTDNYIAPFDSSGGGDGELIIYNPNGADIDVEAFTGADPSSVDDTLTVPAGGYDTYVLPQGSAAGGSDASRVQSAGGEDIYVLAAMDACDDAHDWGGMLLPDDNLTSAILIPLGFGHDPTLETSGYENHSPVWVTPTADTFVYVDFDGDMVPDEVDLNGDGDTSDTVDGVSEPSSDEGMDISELQLLRLHDPNDQDQSGTLRTVAELNRIKDKTLRYQQTMASRRSVMLVADETDDRFPKFSTQTERVAEKLATPGDPPNPWSDVTRVFMDDYDSVSAAQNALVKGFDTGRTLTFYSGHGSTSGWSFQGLMDWHTAQSLSNAGHPTLIGTMSCYTTYFVAPGTDNIGHQLLLAGEQGAALIQGAATLSGFSQNQALLGRATDAMVAGQSVGESVLTARKTLGSSYYDVITNWSVLGDPSLVIDP